jgi:hypothetical protein
MKTTTDKIHFTKKMREIRDKLSLEIMDMSFEQEKEYIRQQLLNLKKEKEGKLPHHENIRGASYYK